MDQSPLITSYASFLLELLLIDIAEFILQNNLLS